PLPQLPTAECVQIRPRRHQPEWLVSAVCQEDVVLFVPSTSGSDRYRVVGLACGRASSDKCQGSPCSSSAPRHGGHGIALALDQGLAQVASTKGCAGRSRMPCIRSKAFKLRT